MDNWRFYQLFSYIKKHLLIDIQPNFLPRTFVKFSGNKFIFNFQTCMQNRYISEKRLPKLKTSKSNKQYIKQILHSYRSTESKDINKLWIRGVQAKLQNFTVSWHIYHFTSISWSSETKKGGGKSIHFLKALFKTNLESNISTQWLRGYLKYSAPNFCTLRCCTNSLKWMLKQKIYIYVMFNWWQLVNHGIYQKSVYKIEFYRSENHVDKFSAFSALR